jgi:outer membrane receptor for ferrienterochelin and colicins
MLRSLRMLSMTCAMLLWTASAVAAQNGAISGRVTDARTGRPLGGAQVRASSPGATFVGSTRDDGSYRLAGLPPGTYTVSVTRIGFAPATVSNVSVSAGATATADIQLTESAIELNPVVTTASRREEKALDAPASVSVIELRQIQEKPAVTVADHIQGLAGVDVSRGGVAQANVVARGFNNAFSGALLTLQDYRFAGVPSLRVNVPLLFTSTSDDIERVEVLLGPASALYGPNSSNGVLHIITKSPFTAQGTSLTIDGGGQSLFRGSLRHAGLLSDKLGFKVSGEYFRATDFSSYTARDTVGYTIPRYDPGEPDVFPDAAPPGRRGQPNVRDFEIERAVGEVRLDVRPTANSEYVTTIGLSRIGNALEYTGANGTAQARNWTYLSVQQRARVGRFFAQAFANFSNSGNDDSLDVRGTFLLRSGQPIVDQSRVFAAQLQHGINPRPWQDFIYGLDYIFTNPRTGNTINGRNEDIDDVREIGGYIQSTTRLGRHWDLVAALRVDKNDQIEGTQVSPRAALLFKPSETQNLRFTYNRAFGTPANFTWFLDLIQARNIAGLPYNIRALGNPPKRGWSFRRDCPATVSGGLCMRTIFAGPQGESQWFPASAAVALPGVIGANATQLAAGLAPGIQALGVPAAQAQALAQQLVQYMAGLRPSPDQVGTEIRFLGAPASANLAPDQIRDIDPIKASFNNSYEIGYKGIVGNNARLSIDLWQEKRGDVGNPAGLATPNVFFNRSTLQSYLSQQLVPPIAQALQQMGVPPAQAQAQAQAAAAQIAANISGTFAPLPLGIVTFNDDRFASARDVYATYTSYNKTITVRGVDLALDVALNDYWTLGTTYSWVSDNVFPEVLSSNQRPLMLNAPDNKGTLQLQFRDETRYWGFNVRTRYTNAYPVNSGVYATGVKFPRPGAAGSYLYEGVRTAVIFDAGLNWRPPVGTRNILWSLNADNVFNHYYRTMPGMPLLGRLVVTRVQYTF